MPKISLNEVVKVVEGQVVSRPSKVIKSPYVCDLMIEESNEQRLAHTPSLGCNGMVDKDAKVIAVKRDSGKCEYSVVCANCEEKGHTYLVGVEPSLAEGFAGEILTSGVLIGLKAKEGTLKTQQTYKDCRFDYCGLTTNNEPFICEVKNVSIAVYENQSPRTLSKMDFSEREYDSKTAVFPSGYKPKGATHSERALKHTKTLSNLKQTRPEVRCAILFIVQRDDVEKFEPSNGDVIYKEALKEAKESGVEIYAVCVKWDEMITTSNGSCSSTNGSSDTISAQQIRATVCKKQLNVVL